MPKQSQPVRICPICSAAGSILGNERLWPRGWRCPSCGHTLVIRAEVPCLAPELDGEDVGFEAVLGGVGAALRHGGVLIAAVPQHQWLWSESDDLGHHVRRYRMGELDRKARAAGFDLRFADSFVSLLLPAMAISRLMGRIGPGRATREQPSRGCE